jgi:His-Xaa-Ser system radical SAM maturase HxsC
MMELIQEPPEVMGITGGEPTLLKDDLVRLLEALKVRFPNTYVHMLTNGRLYSYREFVAKVAAVRHPAFTSAVPLYGDTAALHDYVVQAKGAFDQTVEGLYNAAAHRLDLEIRVVLHRQTIPRLPQLAEFIYRSFPFVRHVALMGLENMGYVKKNWELLWIDPVDYASELQRTVEYLYCRGMNVSIYNLQLCLLPRSLWGFARQSISDFKNIYLDECAACSVKEHCAGVFLSSQNRHSAHIRAIASAA